MEVNPIGSTPGDSQASSTPEVQRKLELGQDAFMKLLLAQLKYQDPLSPMEDRDFIAQLAQFSSLAQMQELNQSISELAAVQSLSNAAAFMGKTVSGINEAGESVTGVAEAAIMREGKVYLRVGDEDLPIVTIREVTLGDQDG